MMDEQQLEVKPQPRNFQIPGCSVSICSEENGVPVEDLLSIVFNLAANDPGAIVDFGLTVRGN